MRYQIYCEKKTDDSLIYIINMLPLRVRTSLTDFLCTQSVEQINELRLRDGSCISLIGDSKNIKTDIYLKNGELEEIFHALCGGAVYAHFDTIKEGYISLGYGIRAGICGKASLNNGTICGISEISSINIRFPKRIYNCANELFDFLKKNNFSTSVLIYSAPGVGKTTILREIVYLLSKAPEHIRFAVIDSREEIIPALDKSELCADVFSGYPKGIGIEIATKSMTSEIIICDEISSFDEAQAVLKASNCGVKLIATVHASSFEELCSRAILEDLINHNAFDYAVGIARDVGSRKFKFSFDALNGVLK